MNWYLKALKQYATFNGRAQRSEYWYFVLFLIIGVFILLMVDIMIDTFDEKKELGLLSSLFFISHFLPLLAVTVRRLHDINKSVLWYCINFIPLGTIVFFIFLIMDSKRDNKYGMNPKMI